MTDHDRPSDELTIVIHLPQPPDAVITVLRALAGIWPDVLIDGNRIDIPAED